MDVCQAIAKRRSIRKFHNRTIPPAVLERIVDLARYYPTPANLQPLRFIVTTNAGHCACVFSCLKWGGYLERYRIEPQNRPTAYILVLADPKLAASSAFSAGAAATELMLAAQAQGIASCCLTPARTGPIEASFSLDPNRLNLLCVIALGYGAQESQVVDQEDTPRYRLDDSGNLVVPKLRTEEIVSWDV